jgi:hypothetical protein
VNTDRQKTEVPVPDNEAQNWFIGSSPRSAGRRGNFESKRAVTSSERGETGSALALRDS